MDPTPQPAPPSASQSAVSSYRIRREAAGWRLDRGEVRLGLFADPAEAVAEACRSAKADADHGGLAIVTAETVPRELHCYMPPERTSAQGDGVSTYLRLAANR